MVNKNAPKTTPDEPMIYQIRLKGHLEYRWTEWFEGLTITLVENGETILTGPIADQSALHGILKKTRDLGLPLLSVISVEPDQTNSSDLKNNQKQP